MPEPRKGRPYRRLQAWVYATYTHCCRCGGYVDQTIPNPRDPMARSMDHYPDPLVLGGEKLSRKNANLAHYRCNASAGAKLGNALRPLRSPRRGYRRRTVRGHGTGGRPTLAALIAQASPSREW